MASSVVAEDFDDSVLLQAYENYEQNQEEGDEDGAPRDERQEEGDEDAAPRDERQEDGASSDATSRDEELKREQSGKFQHGSAQGERG